MEAAEDQMASAAITMPNSTAIAIQTPPENRTHCNKQRPADGRVVYTNVRSIMNKSDELQDWVAET